MARLSFFKLPFIFVVLYFLSDSCMAIGQVAIQMIPLADGYGDLWGYLLTFLPYQFYSLVPDCLLLFGVSSIALYRVNVHVVTTKNIILLVVNAFILLALTYVLGLIFKSILDEVLTNNPDSDPDTWFLLCTNLPLALFYLLGSLSTYYFIKALGDQFDKDKNPFRLTNVNSPRIHFTLFLAFFFFIAIVLYSCMIDIWLRYPYHVDTGVFNGLLASLLMTMIAVLVVILVVKNMFTQAFVVLQSDRVIKSAVLSNLLILIVNAIFIIIDVILLITTIFDHTMSRNVLSILLILMLIMQVSLSCIIIRKVTKRYFYRAISSKI